MKKILLLAFVLISVIANCQSPSPIFIKPSNTYGTRSNRAEFDSTLYFPTGCGAPTDSTFLFTMQNGGRGEKPKLYAFYGDSCGHAVYIWDPALQAWAAIGSGSGGSDSAISGINGVLVTIAGSIRYLQSDTFYNASRARLLQVIDSMKIRNDLRYLQIADSTGTNAYATFDRLRKVVDSLRALKWNADRIQGIAVNATSPTSIGQGLFYDPGTNTYGVAFPFVAVNQSITGNGQPGQNLTLVNDLTTPGNDEHYGTHPTTGVKGWYPNTGAGSTPVFGYNVRGDSAGINGVNNVGVKDNPYNDPLYQGFNLKNIQIAFAKMRDGTQITMGADTTQLHILFWGMHSFGDKKELYDQHLKEALATKFPFAGPGFMGGPMDAFGYSNVITGRNWTIRQFGTVPAGRGLDGRSIVSTNSALDLTISSAGSSLSYITYSDLDIYYYGVSGGGSFSVTIDGTGMGTTNTSSTGGFQVISFHNLGLNTHTVIIHQTSFNTAGIELLGVRAYVRQFKGIILDNAAQGSSASGDWVLQDPFLQKQEIAAVKPDAIFLNVGINDANRNVDTLVYKNNIDTLVNRAKAACPLCDILLIGTTDYGYARWGHPTYPVRSYNNQLRELALEKKVAFWDEYLLVDTFTIGYPRGYINQGDSLHLTPQGAFASMYNLFSRIGAFSIDAGVIPKSFMRDNDTLRNQSLVGPYRSLDFTYVSGGLFFTDFNKLEFENSGGGSFMIDNTGVGAGSGELFFTTSAQDYNFDKDIVGQGLLHVQGTGTSQVDGKLSVLGGGITSGADVEVHKVSGTTNIVRVRLDDGTGIGALQFYNDAGLAAQEGATGTSSTFGGLFQPGTFQILGEQGNMVIGNATNNDLLFATNSVEVGKFDAAGHFIIHNIGVGTAGVDSPMVEANGVIKRIAPSSGSSGVTTVGTFSGSGQTNGASISTSTITFGPVTSSNPGMVTAVNTYTPTATVASGTATISAADAIYYQIGNTIHVSGQFQIASAVAAGLEVDVSLPVAPTNYRLYGTSSYYVTGVPNAAALVGSTSGSHVARVVVTASAVTGFASFTFDYTL